MTKKKKKRRNVLLDTPDKVENYLNDILTRSDINEGERRYRIEKLKHIRELAISVLANWITENAPDKCRLGYEGLLALRATETTEALAKKLSPNDTGSVASIEIQRLLTKLAPEHLPEGTDVSSNTVSDEDRDWVRAYQAAKSQTEQLALIEQAIAAYRAKNLPVADFASAVFNEEKDLKLRGRLIEAVSQEIQLESASWLSQLAEAEDIDPAQRRMIRRGLYELKRRGMEPPVVAPTMEVEALVTSCDDTGSYSIIFTIKGQRKLYTVVSFVLNLEAGIRDAFRRSGLPSETAEKMLKDISADGGLALAPVSPGMAVSMVYQGATINKNEGIPLPREFDYCLESLSTIDEEPGEAEPDILWSPEELRAASVDAPRLFERPEYQSLYILPSERIQDEVLTLYQESGENAQPIDEELRAIAGRFLKEYEDEEESELRKSIKSKLTHNAWIHQNAGAEQAALWAVAARERIQNEPLEANSFMIRLALHSLQMMAPSDDAENGETEEDIERSELSFRYFQGRGTARRGEIGALELALNAYRLLDIINPALPALQQLTTEQELDLAIWCGHQAADFVLSRCAPCPDQCPRHPDELTDEVACGLSPKGSMAKGNFFTHYLSESLIGRINVLPQINDELTSEISFELGKEMSGKIIDACFGVCRHKCLQNPKSDGTQLLNLDFSPCPRRTNKE